MTRHSDFVIRHSFVIRISSFVIPGLGIEMRVCFLGTGGYHPNGRRHTASILLPEIGVALDAGTSLFRVPERLSTRELSIFLTHAHLDHIVGLPCLLTPLLLGRIDRVRVSSAPEYLDA